MKSNLSNSFLSNKSIFILISCFYLSSLNGQPLSVQSVTCYGGSEHDGLYSITETKDNGFLLTGVTNSNDGDIVGYHIGTCFANPNTYPCYDALIIKIDSAMNIVWNISFGGSEDDFAIEGIQIHDDNFVVVGTAKSQDGDVISNHGGKDATIIKFDNSGNILWSKCYGGTNYEGFNSIRETSDSGFIAIGSTLSNDGDVLGNHGFWDIWIVKLDSLGNLLWQKCIGGSSEDRGINIYETIEHNFICAGYSSSNDGDIISNHVASKEYWLSQLDSIGNIIWQKSYGGYGDDQCNYLKIVNDSEYVMTGNTNSIDGDVDPNIDSQYSNIWCLKVKANGQIIWKKTLGGSLPDYSYNLVTNNLNETIISGSTLSNDGDVTNNHFPGSDFWLINLDSNGDINWQYSIGGSGQEDGGIFNYISDGNYLLAGNTMSNDGDIHGNHGFSDICTIKLDISGAGINDLINYTQFTFPNPSNGHFKCLLKQNETDIFIFNILGELIYKNNLESLTNNVNIDISWISPGIYFFKTNQNRVNKIIKY